MAESMKNYFRILVDCGAKDASIKKKIFFRKKMKSRNIESFPVIIFESNSEGIGAKIDEKFHVFQNVPFYNPLLMTPMNHLISIRAL